MSTPPDQPLVPPSTPEPVPGDPWAPPGPQQAPPPPPAYPTAAGYDPASGYAGPPWPQQPPTAWGAQPYAPTGTEAEPALRKARTALGWAIGAAVGALLALGFAVLALVAVVGSSADTFEDAMYAPLRDQVEGFEDGDALPGPVLVGRLRDLLAEEGVSLRDIAVSCPDTASVTASTVVVCSGDVEGLQWTGVVFFEDGEGTFVVLET